MAQHRGEIAGQPRLHGLKIDDLFVLDDAEPQPGVRRKADNFHEIPP